MFRQVSILVPTDFKFGTIQRGVVCCWALEQTKLCLVGGEIGLNVPDVLDFLKLGRRNDGKNQISKTKDDTVPTIMEFSRFVPKGSALRPS